MDLVTAATTWLSSAAVAKKTDRQTWPDFLVPFFFQGGGRVNERNSLHIQKNAEKNIISRPDVQTALY